MEQMLKDGLLRLQRYYQSGVTKEPDFSLPFLKKLEEVLDEMEDEIYQALYADLRKNPAECYTTEISVVKKEIRYFRKNLKSLRKPVRKRAELINLPSSAWLYPEPLGVVLIISPWNYPLNLSLTPLVTAIAAGNVVALKPSEKSPHTSLLIEKLIKKTFPEDLVMVVQGDGDKVVPAMMEAIRFDHIFFTGNGNVGRIIYQEAAKALIPVTLELGGKNPAIVTDSADLKIAAKRIALAKFTNAGQTCLAPDYVIAQESIRGRLIEEFKTAIKSFYGEHPLQNPELGKIISQDAYERIKSYLREGEILYGGKYDDAHHMIEPTLLGNIREGAKVMQDEIFGPVLPVLTYKDEEALDQYLTAYGEPLGMYIFTKDKEIEKRFIGKYRFGGGCVNNAAMHFMNHNLPFGGIGTSGLGAYHGKVGFDRFTHFKPVLKTPEWPDPGIKYPPFKNRLKWFKKLLG